jgi:hypothetical protein
VTCRVVPIPGAGAAIVCGGKTPRNAPRCWECGKPADHQCDFPTGKKTTCDLHTCAEHRRPVGPNLDYCNKHPRPKAAATKEAP